MAALVFACLLCPLRTVCNQMDVKNKCPFPPFSFTGGRYVKVWDILKGGQLLVSLRNHHKTVTCLCLSSSGQRLLSGSLDRFVYFTIFQAFLAGIACR